MNTFDTTDQIKGTFRSIVWNSAIRCIIKIQRNQFNYAVFIV